MPKGTGVDRSIRTAVIPLTAALLMVTLSGCDGSEPDTGQSRAMGPPGTVTIVFEQLQDVGGLIVDSRVLPMNPSEENPFLGGTLSVVDRSPFSASEVMRPLDSDSFYRPGVGIATFDPGTYRFAIEAYVSSGPMRHGCERSIDLLEGEALTITISELPRYSGGGFHWAPIGDLRFPDCPESVRVDRQ